MLDTCKQCGVSGLENFYVKDGKRTNSMCKECHKAACKVRWHSKTQQEKQATRVRTMYGINPEEYLELYTVQEGKCAICGEEPTTQRGLHLDHCHATGTVRGLLCHGCNTGIGSLKDDPELLRKALNYLEETK